MRTPLKKPPALAFPEVPLCEWDYATLHWSARYWHGKWKAARHKKEKAKWWNAYSRAQAEIIARKLAAS